MLVAASRHPEGGGPAWGSRWQDLASRMIRPAPCRATPAGFSVIDEARHSRLTCTGAARSLLVQRDAIAYNTHNNAFDNHCLFFEINPDRFEVFVLRH